MPALLAVAAAASLAAASAPSRSLPYDSVRDPLVTSVAGAGWFFSQLFQDRLAPPVCRWCDPPAFDAAVRDRLRWQDTGAAGLASDVLAYGGVPLAGLGADFFVSGRDAKAAGTDALIAAETAALAGLFGQAVKLAVARERPGTHPRDGSSDEHASFYSGHTSAAFAVAVSLATCASLRGDRDAWVAWAAGLPLAAAAGYLRIAADRHYLSDVLAGAGAGTLFGILVPRVLHSPGAASSPQPGATRLPALTFGGRF